MVHRDLKPDNVFLVPTEIGGELVDQVKVLDFGISKIRGSQTVQTQDAVLLGTPQYMAPEQALGKNTEIDARTDVFALGAIVYEMLSGRPAFVGDDAGRGGVQGGATTSSRRWRSWRRTLPKNVRRRRRAGAGEGSATRASPTWAAFVNALTGRPLQTLDRAKAKNAGAGGVRVDAGGGVGGAPAGVATTGARGEVAPAIPPTTAPVTAAARAAAARRSWRSPRAW